MRRLNVKARSREQLVEHLSGGNQQKVALARVLHQDADVLLFDEPTRGIDVGTKIGDLSPDGATGGRRQGDHLRQLLLHRAAGVCDRVGVMARGRLREIRPAGEWTCASILSCALGVDAS